MTVATADFAAALDTAMVYPNGRITTSHGGYTDRGEHSHVAATTTNRQGDTTTHYLCGIPARTGRLTWPDRTNISCARCRTTISQKKAVLT